MLKRTYFMAVIDDEFCLRMGAVHLVDILAVSRLIKGTIYSEKNHKSLGGP